MLLSIKEIWAPSPAPNPRGLFGKPVNIIGGEEKEKTFFPPLKNSSVIVQLFDTTTKYYVNDYRQGKVEERALLSRGTKGIAFRKGASLEQGDDRGRTLVIKVFGDEKKIIEESCAVLFHAYMFIIH